MISKQFEKAKSFLSINRDSSFFYFQTLISTSKDSLQIAKALNYMASIQSDAGDFYGGQESLISSLRYLDRTRKKDRRCLSSDYNELGMLSFKLKNFSTAILYFDKAIKLADDDGSRLVMFNNKANTLQEYKDYRGALRIYNKILAKTQKDKGDYARVLTNAAMTQWQQNAFYNPLPALKKALSIRIRIHDLWGENSSYAHLADFYLKSRQDSAMYYAKKMYRISRSLRSPDDELEALDKLIKTSPPSVTVAYFTRYQKLNDSLQTVRNAAKNQFALIRYNVELGKADNLRLQKDISDKKYQLVIRNTLLTIGIIVLVMLIVGALAWYQRYRRFKEVEKQEAIRDTWRQASKDVHDSLSNDIYLLMKRIKHDKQLDRTWLQRHSELLYSRSRNISHEIIADISNDSFPEKLRNLLMSFSTDNTKVSLVLNDDSFWYDVALKNKLEIKMILQELMVNMQKHSSAENVVLKFQANGPERHIVYIDDGIGIQHAQTHKNGLNNAETRIKDIGGKITFGNNDGVGLKIQLSFPLV